MGNTLHRGRVLTDAQIGELRADIEMLENIQSRDIGDGALHDAAQSIIDIAEADLAAGNQPYVGTLVAQDAAKRIGKAAELAQKSQEAVKEALEASKEAIQAFKEAKKALEMGCFFLGAGKADEDTQSAEQLRN